MSADAFAPAVFPRLHDADLEAERERARRHGFVAGHAAGFRAAALATEAETEAARAHRAAADAEAARRVAEAVAMLQTAAAALTRRTRELTAATQAQVFAHAVELATVLLAGELADGETSARAAVRRALGADDAAEVRELRLHPDDLATLARLDIRPDGVVLTADADLAPGDAVAVLDEGHVDARVGAALERARRAIAEATT
nr:FliH/SctL family protein [Microbacterium bovistercoris]